MIFCGVIYEMNKCFFYVRFVLIMFGKIVSGCIINNIVVINNIIFRLMFEKIDLMRFVVNRMNMLEIKIVVMVFLKC